MTIQPPKSKFLRKAGKMILICEFCGEEDKESLQIVLDKWACWKCYPKKKYIEQRIKQTSGHRYNCTCHGCCALEELGYIQDENKNWKGGN